MKQKGNILLIILATIGIIAISVGGYFWWSSFAKAPADKQELTWEECIKISGARMLLTYPGVCVSPDGRKVTQPLSDEEKRKIQPPTIDNQPDTNSPKLDWGPYKILSNDILDVSDWQKYTDQEGKFYLMYPRNWFFKDGILSNYEISGTSFGSNLPKYSVKCDLGPLNIGQAEEKLAILNRNTIISIFSWVTTGEGEPAGLRRYGYLFEKENYSSVTFVCFFWDTLYDREVKTIVQSFKFL